MIHVDERHKKYGKKRVLPLTIDVKTFSRVSALIADTEKEKIPKNLCIRVSGAMIDGPSSKAWPWTSTVSTTNRSCPAADQGNECRDCRQCWDRNALNITYGKH